MLYFRDKYGCADRNLVASNLCAVWSLKGFSGKQLLFRSETFLSPFPKWPSDQQWFKDKHTCLLPRLSCCQQKIFEIAGKVSKKSRDEDFPCFRFPSTFQQSCSCLCTTPLLSWEPGDVSPWLGHRSVWGLCVFRYSGPRSTFGTRSAGHNTAPSLVGALWPGVENSSSIYTFLAMQWISSLFPAQISMRAKPGHDVHHC